MNDDELPPPPEDDGETVDIVMPPAKMVVNIRSQDALQLMVSKSCLEVLTNLGQVNVYSPTIRVTLFLTINFVTLRKKNYSRSNWLTC